MLQETITFIQPSFPTSQLPSSPASLRCTASPRPNPPAHPFSKKESSTLLQRMLHIAITEENYSLAASLRDATERLRSLEPTHTLRKRLEEAVHQQHFSEAAILRDEIERTEMFVQAETYKPRYPLGLVVLHKRKGYRMVLFGADYDGKERGEGEERGLQAWYHAAVDERDGKKGEGENNIIYVPEEDCIPCGRGVEIQHPIIRIMFRGLKPGTGYSWYIAAGDEEDEH